MPVLKLSLTKRKFILINDQTATITGCQKLFGITDEQVRDTYPNLRLNWSTDGDGVFKSGYETQEQYRPVVNGLCEWLQKVGVTTPEPVITVEEGWKVLFDGWPVGPKLDFYHTKGSKYFFPKEFYNNFPVFYTKEECFAALKRQVEYMLDQIRLKGFYSSLNGGIASEIKQMGYL